MSKNKRAKWASGVPVSRGTYDRGVRQTVVYMKIIYLTWRKLKATKEGSDWNRMELEVVYNICTKVLLEFFNLGKKKLREYWRNVNEALVQTKVDELYRKMTSKIIIPGERKDVRQIIMADRKVDMEKIRQELEHDKTIQNR